MAETAHQALLYFLNKPDELYGSAAALKSVEYQAMKAEAIDELRRLNEMPQTSASKHETDLKCLYDVVIGHMLSTANEVHRKPLTWREIRERLPQEPKPWGQVDISRVMARLLKAPGARGMTAYGVFFRTGKPHEAKESLFDAVSRATGQSVDDGKPGKSAM